MSLRVAIVGCGKFADSHVEGIMKQRGGRLIAVCDSEPLMAEQVAVRYAVPSWYTHIDQMLDAARPDVVHIITPPHTHLPLARRALAAGCHVFVEKPVTLSLDDTRSLIDCAVSTGRKMTTGWRVLFDPPALLVNALVEAGVVGDPVHVESFYGYDLSGPFGAAIVANRDHWVRRLPGGLFHNNIDHLLNKFPQFFRGEKPAVAAHATCFRPRGGLQDELRVMLSGQRVTGFGNFSANSKPTAQTMTIFGTKRTLHVDYVSRTITYPDGPKLPSAIGRLLTPFSQGFQYQREGLHNVVRFLKSSYHFNAGLSELIRRFYDSIVDNTEPPIAYPDILWVSAIMDQVFAQACSPDAVAARSAAVC